MLPLATRAVLLPVFVTGFALLGCSGHTVTLPDSGAGNGGSAGSSMLAEGSPSTAGSGGAGTNVGGSTTSAGAGAGSGGAEGSSGGTLAGGASGGGVGGNAGAAGGNAGAGGAAQAPYACSEFLGPNVTGEWFAAGFEQHVDGAKWQVKAPHASLVEYWADANHKVWLESCQDEFYDCETKSKCENADVDRVYFVTAKENYLNTAQPIWEADIDAAIATIKVKYPKLRHIELMTFVRAPDGHSCGNQTTVSSLLDAAQAAVAARSHGFVTVAPHFNVPDCNVFESAPHMTPQGNATMGNLIGEHYAEQ